jgi:holo-[acyl-carrier protein] synthase
MILGLGSDLTDIRRIAASLERFGDRFIGRVFTEVERERSEAARDRAASYAKRWAAKEAFAKALGSGIAEGVALRDIGVVNDVAGRPSLALTGGAAASLAALTPEGMIVRVHLTLTDAPPWAQALVVIEALPTPP